MDYAGDSPAEQTEIIQRLQSHIKDLELWKVEQMKVAADTHYHEIAKEIGLTIGDYIAPAILPNIQYLKAELAAAKELLREIRVSIEGSRSNFGITVAAKISAFLNQQQRKETNEEQ